MSAVRRAGARSKTVPAGAKTESEAPVKRARLRLGTKCSSACLTRDHKSWGECIRAKGLQISPAINDNYGSKQSQWDKDLNHYESAVNQGLQPEGTQRHQVDKALKEAERGV